MYFKAAFNTVLKNALMVSGFLFKFPVENEMLLLLYLIYAMR